MNDYQPIQTRAEKRAEKWRSRRDAAVDWTKNRIHERTRLSTIFSEIGQTLGRKFQQGADEIVNMLYSGSAYLPWPGPSNQGPQPFQQAVHQAPAAKPVEIPSQNADLNFGASKPTPDPHRDMYTSGSGSVQPLSCEPAEVNLGNLRPEPEPHRNAYSCDPKAYAKSKQPRSKEMEL